MNSNRLRQQQKLKTLQRGTLIVACFSIATIVSYLIIGLSQTNSTDTNAAGRKNLLVSDPINNGEIICGFTWEHDLPVVADVGPSAEKINPNAEVTADGCENTNGLCAGNNGRNINMYIPADKIFNTDGIDVSVDFRRFEESGSFFTRGTYFNFGMKDGMIAIKFKYKGEDGKLYNVDEIARYNIPKDTIFRNYRFYYNPQDLKAEIFVDNVAVWSNQNENGGKLWWNETDPLIIGDEMNGESCGKAIMDNLVIRNTVRGRTMPLQLLSFTAEIQGQNVMLNWFTCKENGTDFFIIERSSDTYKYEEVGKVKASGKTNDLHAYALLDTKPSTGISYYRLSMPRTDVKSVWVPVIAFKFPPANAPSLSHPVSEVKSVMNN